MSTRLGDAPEQELDPAAADVRLVDAIRTGRTEAWDEVYRRHVDRVYGVCFSVLRNRADAEDASQATFLRAVERLDQLRDGRSLKAWLSGIARRTSIDRIRNSREAPVDDWPTGEPADEPDLAGGLSRRETIALVVEALDGLEVRDRLALVLADVEDFDGDALAETLGVRRDHAYTIVGRARERFGRSVAALVVGRTGRSSCHELAALVGPAGGPLDPRLRKRVARHIDECERCRETRSRRVSPAALLSMLPPIVTPAALRVDASVARVAGAAPARSDGTRPAGPRRAHFSSRLLVAVSTAAVAGAAVVAFAVGRDRPEPEDSVPAQAPASVAATAQAPGSVSTGQVDDFCEVAQEWRVGLAAVPISTSPADVEAWATRNRDYVERLAALAPAAISARWEEYSAGYGGLVETLRGAGWDVGAAGDDAALSHVRDEIESDLAVRCGVSGGR